MYFAGDFCPKVEHDLINKRWTYKVKEIHKDVLGKHGKVVQILKFIFLSYKIGINNHL